MKPWYCKTEGYTTQQIQDAFDLCIKNGCCRNEGYESENINIILSHLHNYKFFGIDEFSNGYFSLTNHGFADGTVEITLDQLPTHIGIETPEEKEAFDCMSKVIDCNKKDNHQLLSEICESLLGQNTENCRHGDVLLIQKMIDGGWVKERGNE